MLTQEYTGTVVIIECCRCSVTFGLDDGFYRTRRRDHQNFYCPNGHPQHYQQESDVEKARRQAREAEERAQLARQNASFWRDQEQAARNRERSQKAAKTRIKNRVAAGVCPCCNRTFQDLARHMAGQHPDWTDSS